MRIVTSTTVDLAIKAIDDATGTFFENKDGVAYANVCADAVADIDIKQLTADEVSRIEYALSAPFYHLIRCGKSKEITQRLRDVRASYTKAVATV